MRVHYTIHNRFRSASTESLIVFQQDFAILIAHVLVLTLREPGVYPGGIHPVRSARTTVSPTYCKSSNKPTPVARLLGDLVDVWQQEGAYWRIYGILTDTGCAHLALCGQSIDSDEA